MSISLPVFSPISNLKPQYFCNSQDGKKVILNLSSKAYVPDYIPVVILKNCVSELSYILPELFTNGLKEFCFPDCWKVSLVVPVFKNVRERSTAKNYLLALLVFLLSKNLEIIWLLITYRIAFNRPGTTPAVALDISKAFGRVWMMVFFTKLNLM